MSLFQPPDSRYWWYSFYFEGKRYRSSTKQTKKTAAAVVEATLLARLQEGEAQIFRTKKSPTLREFSVRFLEWAENSQRLSPNGKRYYRYGWRLLSYSKLAGMRLDQITQDIAESIVFCRPAINRKKKDTEGKCLTQEELIPCTGHNTNQALRTLKRMQSKALEWRVLRQTPKISLTDAPGRDRLIDDRTETISSSPTENQSDIAGQSSCVIRLGWFWLFCRIAGCAQMRCSQCELKTFIGTQIAFGYRKAKPPKPVDSLP